jgi:hypothetical protein
MSDRQWELVLAGTTTVIDGGALKIPDQRIGLYEIGVSLSERGDRLLLTGESGG